MIEPEFSHLVDRHRLPDGPLLLSASDDERRALAERFTLVEIKSLTATVTLIDDGQAVTAAGRLQARIIQSCAVSGEDLPVTIDEPLALRFVPDTPVEGDEIELAADALDDLPFSGDAFDLGEAVAQSLGLAIDPYAVGPEAERIRAEILSAQEASGPFAALASLKKNDG